MEILNLMQEIKMSLNPNFKTTELFENQSFHIQILINE